MTWHIVCLTGPTDRYSPTMSTEDNVLFVPFDVPGHPDSHQTSVPDVLAQYALMPTSGAGDLLRAAIAAYTGDLRVSRRQAYDGWTRDLVLHLAVREPDGWRTGSTIFQRLLSFLTGDHWQIVVRPAPDDYRPVQGRVHGNVSSLHTNTVSLYSGGLDSYIGAIDLLERQEQVALIGHHAAGQGPTSTAQRRAISSLREVYPTERTPFLQCWLSPPKGARRASEITTRGRSILFLALGIAVASCLEDSRLTIPENGFISLNVPLTSPRSGSFSTRTTHPHLIGLLSDLLAQLGIPVRLELPYRFQTKGEMLVGCANQDALSRGIVETMSCAHPGAGRFIKGGSPNRHCGYCVPCIIRRSAIAYWGADPTSYIWGDLTEPMSVERRADLRAIQLALQHFNHHPASLANVLTAGPLPATIEERTEYVDVFRRGIAELGSFINDFHNAYH